MKFSFNENQYTPKGLETVPINNLKHEYRLLREEANKRLAEFQGTKWVDTKAYKSNINEYNQNIARMTKKDLEYKLSQVYDFLNAKTSTVEGNEEIQSHVLDSLRDIGYKGITEDNFLKFGQYMEAMRDIYTDILFDSEQAAEIFETYQDLDINRIIDIYEKNN